MLHITGKATAIFLILVVPHFGAGCVGSIGDVSPLPRPGAMAPPGGGGGAGGGGGENGGNVVDPLPIDKKRWMPGKVCGAIPNPKVGPGPAPLRRLTRAEYDNTILDLLGDDSKPSADFPADAKLPGGFDNNASQQVVTTTLADDYFQAAETLAAKAVLKPAIVPVCAGGAGAEEGCAASFISDFGKRAFRRPLSGGETLIYVNLYKAARAMGGDHKTGMRYVLTSFLQAPYFLYRSEFGQLPGGKGLTSWEMASRLSYLLWNTMPDPTLFAAADANALQTKDQVKAQAERMLMDAKAHRMVARFHGQWLGLEKMVELQKDDKVLKTPVPFASVKPSMTEETARFLEDAFWQGDGSVEKLFTSPTSFMNKDLATFLGIPNTAGTTLTWKPVALDPAQRIGLLTQASLLSVYAKPTETSPIKRGKFVLEQMLCVEVPPPPPDVNNTLPAPKPGQTTRGRFVEHEKEACAACHRIMDPVGFAYESFDAAGRWRTLDAGKPVDTTGAIRASDIGTQNDASFAGAVELSKLIGDSSEMKKCVATQWLRFALGREEVDADASSLEQLFCSFEADAKTFNMRDLLIGITQTESFLGRVGGTP